MPRHTIATSEFTEKLILEVQEYLNRIRRKPVSYSEALNWLVEDFMFHPPDVPAFGKFSPVMFGILSDLLEKDETDTT